MTKRTTSQNKTERNRNWTFIIYPESTPENWKEILRDDLHLTFCTSPLHDSDTNEDGSPKKAHFHLVLAFEGNKSQDQIEHIAKKVNGTTVFPVISMQGMIQYLIHRNNPEKHQYNKDEICCYGGFEIDQYFAPSSSQLQKMSEDLDQYIIDMGITEFDELYQAARIINKEWAYILKNRNTVFYKTWLYNRAMLKREDEKQKKESEEIINNIAKEVKH